MSLRVKDITRSRMPFFLVGQKLKFIFFFSFLFVYMPTVNAQSNTVGLILNDSTESYNGYTLFSPIPSDNTYLINNDGSLVHSWTSDYRPGQSVMLLPDGDLLRTAVLTNNSFNAGGSAGRVERYDWNGNLKWSFNYSYPDSCTHHDVAYMPNGDILMISWERISYAAAIAAGRNPANLGSDLWSEKIIEVKPSGTSGGDIVWEWHVWDHLIQDYDATKANYGTVADHPGLIDVNYGGTGEDWLHINSVRYNPARDEILLSVHNFSEIWVIDHSTTTSQAAGHSGGNSGKGGDILYRWGNPQAYGAGTANDRMLFTQHDARWIDPGLPGAGDILIFNNGVGRGYSSVDEITPPLDSNGNYYLENSGKYGPDTLTWRYTNPSPDTFYAQNISGADRLPNGNTLICEGTAGKFFEVDSAGKTVWEYINPVSGNGILTQGDTPVKNLVFKIYRYAPTYSGLAGKDLTPSGPIENVSTAISNTGSGPAGFVLQQNYPNPFNPTTIIRYTLPKPEHVLISVYNDVGQKVATLENEMQSSGSHSVEFDGNHCASGVYFYSINAGTFHAVKKLMLIR